MASAKRKAVAVFELGIIPDALADRWPDYAGMITEWLQPAMPDVDYHAVRIARGESVPDVSTFDAYVYSGSRHGVYDDIEWMAPMKQLVREAASLRLPQFGICFGHQLVAEALGGRVEKSDKGWGCGHQEYATMGEGTPGDLSVLVMHQDQVMAVPRNAEVIGGSDFCENGVIDYQVPARTVQFHPEFGHDFVQALLETMGGQSIPAVVADAALKTLHVETHSDRVAEWTADFFRQHGIY